MYYYIREFAVYGPRGGTVRSSWQVVHPNGTVVYNGGKKTAQKLCDKWNKEKEGGAIVKRKFIVSTHVGEFPTWATSPQKAINNIRFRLFGRCSDGRKTIYWTARAA